MALLSAHNRRFSPWVLIILAISIIVCFAIGGGLVNAFYSCLVNLGITTDSCSLGAYQAGLAFLSIGSLASLAWFILLIIFFVSRPLRPHQAQAQYSMNAPATGNFGPAQQQQQQQQQYGMPAQYPASGVPSKEAAYVTVQPLQQNVPAPPYPVQELEASSLGRSQQQYGDRRCGRCEALVNSPFCPRCGSVVATV